MQPSDPVQPFRLSIPDAEIADLRARLTSRRPPSPLPGDDWATGVPESVLASMLEHWRRFDWRAYEADLNALPQFTTVIDGQTLHFIHVVSPVEGALPVLLLHGWPGSFLEFRALIEPLTDPERHGGDRDDAVSVVVPSLPGFGFSTPLVGSDWGATRIAEVLAELMDRLGYDRFAVQGGDVGAGVAPELGRVAPDRVVGVHVNGAVDFATGLDEDAVAALSPLERDRVARIERFLRDEAGYIAIQSTRPGLIGAALADSPAGLMAWILDKLTAWSVPQEASAADVLGLDFVLADVSLYWYTRSAGSSAFVGYAQGGGWGVTPENSGVPTASLQFQHDIGIRSVDERSNTIVRWTDVEDRGGHFAALEEPELLIEDLRAFLRTVRGTVARP
ncbi:epoxide hydrolase family protein [Rathayibacter sp. Leaf296]|uniref:epoxide hydrolase family protein n=1 Tax=Rathayibacter sp. Leaf296 TaxID=1736327 RepID=UPI0007024D64|nr:epoxide hydrolase [Rathayibacter sp. Leaf296]KQQ08207.1 epoxide hydrolase [Rathayibacter sp. Leaf296]